MMRLPLPEHFGVLYAVPVQGTEREQSASAHALLDRVLPEYAEERGIVLPRSLQYGKTDMGKPYLEGIPLHFNLSHCKGLAVCLLSPYVCGVDAEPVRKLRESVVRRVYGEAERRALAESDDPDRLFTQLWTLKESYVKAIGIGISYPMQEVCFTLEEKRIACTKTDATFWQTLRDGFAVSVCVMTGEP